VTYTAGYATIPDELGLAVHYLVAAVRKSADKGGPMGEETLGRYTYKLLGGEASKSGASGIEIITARSILSRYAEPII